MKTDKQVFRIFTAVPEWIFELTQLESPGACQLESFSVKELERRADGLVVPADPSQPLTVVEFQFQADETIYARIVQEMVSVQLAHGMRAVEGLILFAYNGMDPKTEPWVRSVRSFSFDELLAGLERRQPEHPLVAVFKPILVDNDVTLEASAVRYYRQIKQSNLDESARQALVDVFVNWLEQRFRDKNKQEIEAMLIGELPELEETQSGKDLIAIGERRGKQAGKAETILLYLRAKHGPLPKELRRAVLNLSVAKANRLIEHLAHCESLQDVESWLDQDGGTTS
jgi:predicted transposase YdaD